MYGSLPLSRAFRRRLLAVFTEDSAFPFALGLPGLLVSCSNSHRASEFLESVGCKLGSIVTNDLVRASVSGEVTLQFEDHCAGQGVV